MLSVKGWIPFGVLFFNSLTVWSAPTCDALSRRWYDRYLKDIPVTWDTSSFECPGSEAVVALALHDLENIPLRANAGGYKPDLYALTTNKVEIMDYDRRCPYLAYAIREEKRLTLCPGFLTDTREDRASTLFHEARHLDEDDPGHVTCRGGRMDGAMGACDETFRDGARQDSGYNADVFFLNWVMKGSSQTELSKNVMKTLLNSYIPDRFNRITASQVAKWRR